MRYVLFMLFLVLVGCGSDNSAVFVKDGVPGVDGLSAVTEMVQAAPDCRNGGITILSALDANKNGILDETDTNLKSAQVCNGMNGAEAKLSEYTPVGLIAACGNSQNVTFKEQLFCLNNGKLLASFSANNQALSTRLAYLPAGSYSNTDGSNCNFQVSVDNVGNSVVSWNGGSQTCVNNVR